MPNHVTTICTVTGPHADVTAFAERHIHPCAERGKHFDFHTVIPKPAILDETSGGSYAELGMAALVGEVVWIDFTRYTLGGFGVPASILTNAPYLHARRVRAWLAANKPEVLEEGRRCLAAIAETGYPSWYEWSIANWGTKWGAYDYEDRERGDDRFMFKFETAWSFPEPVFRKLAEMYPTLVFAVISFDEGGNFACDGEFNGQNNYRCGRELATEEMYERVYGEKPERDDDEAVS